MGSEARIAGETKRFGCFTLDLARGALLGAGGREIPLRPKPFALLRLLVDNPGTLLTREAIMEVVWPGVFVSDDSISQCVKEIRRALGDDRQTIVRTIPKRGFRFEVEIQDHSTSPTADIPTGRLMPPPQDMPSVLVLPFESQSLNTRDAWLAEAIIEGIIYVLSGLQELLVIAHPSALAYGARLSEPREDAIEFGARYVVKGSVRRITDDEIQVTALLADTATGAVLLSPRHEGRASELFDMQDQIARRIAVSLVPKIRRHELERAMRKHPGNLSVYELMLRGLDLLYRLDLAHFAEAGALLERATEADPAFAPAYAHLATWHMFRIGQGWSPVEARDMEAANRCALAALQRDSENAVALAVHGHMLSFLRHDFETALHFLQKATFAGPSSHMAWALASATHGYVGDGVEAIACATRALQLSPLDPFVFFSEHMLSQAHYVSAQYEEAVIWGRRADEHNMSLTSNLRTLAAALMAIGRQEEARQVASRMLAIEPNFRLRAFAARTPLAPQILADFVDRLRQAGLPE